MVPSSSAQLSMVRQEVVPTQITRPPFTFVRLIESAVSCGMVQYSLCISCLLDLVLLDRSERAEPDVQRHIARRLTPLAAILSRSSGVKCRPAVGAAAEPLTLE